jgi:hypothetical protein
MELALFHPSGIWNFRVDPKCLENLCAPIRGYLFLTSVLHEIDENEEIVKWKFKI